MLPNQTALLGLVGCLLLTTSCNVSETVAVTLPGTNEAPAAISQSLTVGNDGLLSIVLTATDEDNEDPLAFVVVTQPTHGTLSGTGANLTYKAVPPYNATDSFTFQAIDWKSESNIATVTLSLPELASIYPDPLPDYLEIPFTKELNISIDLPLSDSDTLPPINEAPIINAPTVVGTPTLQSTIVRTGKSFSALMPGLTDGTTSGRLSFGSASSVNSLAERSFAIQSWVYLPADQLTGEFDWSGQPVQGQNIIYGGGGPDSFAPRLGVTQILGTPKLVMFGDTGNVESSKAFPLDSWVHVAVTYDHATTSTVLYMDGFPVATSSAQSYSHVGPTQQYNLGSAEYNGPWAMSWKGYISNFRLYIP